MLIQRDIKTVRTYATVVTKIRHNKTKTLINFEKGNKVYLYLYYGYTLPRNLLRKLHL